ncbi:MAG: hypothetical protein ACTHOL_19545 [Luteibacter jiangsuensis]
MSLTESLSTIKLDRATIILLVLADTLGCGLLVIFICWPDVFLVMEAIKLSMLAIALTLPFVTAGTFAYHIGSVNRDYEVASHGLATSVIYAVSAHVIIVLGALAAGAGGVMFSASSLSHAISPRTSFWIGSACYVVYMIAAGKSLEYKRPWLRLIGLILIGGAVGLYQIGKVRNWW